MRITPKFHFTVIGEEVIITCNSFGATKWIFIDWNNLHKATTLSETGNSLRIEIISTNQSGTYVCYGHFKEKLELKPFIAKTRLNICSKYFF